MKVRYCTGGVSILAKTLVEAIACGVAPPCVSPKCATCLSALSAALWIQWVYGPGCPRQWSTVSVKCAVRGLVAGGGRDRERGCSPVHLPHLLARVTGQG